MSLTAPRVAHGDRVRMSARIRGCAGDVMRMSAAAVDGDCVRMIARART